MACWIAESSPDSGLFVVFDENDHPLAFGMSRQDAEAFARLPELVALVQSMSTLLNAATLFAHNNVHRLA